MVQALYMLQTPHFRITLVNHSCLVSLLWPVRLDCSTAHCVILPGYTRAARESVGGAQLRAAADRPALPRHHSRAEMEPQCVVLHVRSDTDDDTDSDELAFGGLVSTSNRVERAVVSVSTSQPLVWTVDIDVARHLAD